MTKSLYLNPARSWLRKLGIIKLISLPTKARIEKRYAQYEREKPSQLEVRGGGCTATMLVSNAQEYARCLSFNEDRHIIQAIITSLKNGDSYWDVGSSIGLYSLLVAQAVGEQGKVIAFEPEAKSFRRLKENIAVNNLANIITFNFALGSEPVQMKLNVSKQASSGTHSLVSTINRANSEQAQNEVQIVGVVVGDRLRLKENLQVPATIKVDVEGAEENVLIGLTETLKHPNCRTVVCEIHFSILESAGESDSPFRILKLIKSSGFNQILWLDHSHIAAYKQN